MKNEEAHRLSINIGKRFLELLRNHTHASIALVISISSLQIFIFAHVSTAAKTEGCLISTFLMMISGFFFYFFFKVFRTILLKINVNSFRLLIWRFELSALGSVFALCLFFCALFSAISFPWTASDLIADGFPPLHWLPSIYAMYWALDKSGWLANHEDNLESQELGSDSKLK